MGRFHPNDEGSMHEGFVVGYVPRDWRAVAVARAFDSKRPVAVLQPYRANGVLRELGMLEDERDIEVQGIYVIGYGCACGWRSPYYECGQPLEWAPCIVHRPEWLDEHLARKWWTPHVEQELQRGR